MKNIKQLILFALFGMLSFAQIASGQGILQADATQDSARLAYSPYAQADPNSSYTFIGISHPDLDTAAPAIGVVIEAINMTTTNNDAGGRAVVFTIDAGETHRVFIVNQGHPNINNLNAAFNDDAPRVHLIPTVNAPQYGSVRVTTVATDPLATVSGTDRYQNLSQLALWGVVYVEATGTGFALEFVGDMQDSNAGGVLTNAGAALDGVTTPGRGIN